MDRRKRRKIRPCISSRLSQVTLIATALSLAVVRFSFAPMSVHNCDHVDWKQLSSINLVQEAMKYPGENMSENSIHDLRAHGEPSPIPEADLPKRLASICKNIQPCITIHLFVYTRANATTELLDNLATSDYSSYGKDLPLVIHLDRPRNNGPNETATWQENRAVERLIVDFEWPHGPKLLDIQSQHVGLKMSWLSAWQHSNPDDLMIALEDDMLVSPLYFQWLLHILGSYNLWQAPNRDQSLLGISLSPILFDEISEQVPPSQAWLPGDHVSPPELPIFLHGVPSSWGGVYFGEHWRRFLSFVAVRGAPPFYEETEEGAGGDPNLRLPNSTTNTWVRSWKRFMFDYAYGRGAYMIYPNLQSLGGLAKSLFLPGEHYNVTNPISAVLIGNRSHLFWDKPLPDYKALPLFDIFGSPMNRTAYIHQGKRFVQQIANLGPQYDELSELWLRGLK